MRLIIRSTDHFLLLDIFFSLSLSIFVSNILLLLAWLTQIYGMLKK